MNPTAEHPLESLLQSLIAEHERLLETTRRHRAAISAADSGEIGRCILEQSEAVQRIAALESRRTSLVGVGEAPAVDSPATLATAALKLPAAARTACWRWETACGRCWPRCTGSTGCWWPRPGRWRRTWTG